MTLPDYPPLTEAELLAHKNLCEKSLECMRKANARGGTSLKDKLAETEMRLVNTALYWYAEANKQPEEAP